MKRQKIYDCFALFNELDLLEIRLKELNDVVDFFVIVESEKNHRGDKKPLYFWENRSRFKKYLKKIKYVKGELPKKNFIDNLSIRLLNSKKLPKFGTKSLGINFITAFFGIGNWKIVYEQRKELMKKLKGLNEEDIVMFSDLDEIPNKEKFSEMKIDLEQKEFVLFRQKKFFYYLNGFAYDNWPGTRACKFKTLKGKLKNNISYLRNPSPAERILSWIGFKRKEAEIKEGGWEFSYLGGIEQLKVKLKASAEVMKKNSSDKAVEEYIKMGRFPTGEKTYLQLKYIPIDNTFPKTITQNKETYRKMIREEAICKNLYILKNQARDGK